MDGQKLLITEFTSLRSQLFRSLLLSPFTGLGIFFLFSGFNTKEGAAAGFCLLCIFSLFVGLTNFIFNRAVFIDKTGQVLADILRVCGFLHIKREYDLREYNRAGITEGRGLRTRRACYILYITNNRSEYILKTFNLKKKKRKGYFAKSLLQPVLFLIRTKKTGTGTNKNPEKNPVLIHTVL